MNIDWHEIAVLRAEANLFPRVISRRQQIARVIERIPKNGDVLDFGAGSRYMKQVLQQGGFGGEYFSLDVSHSYQHDYHSIDEVDRWFDAIICSEVLEHMWPDLAFSILSRLCSALTDEGCLIVTVPNPLYFGAMERDMTHVTGYPAGDLYALLRIAGVAGELTVYRVEDNARSFPEHVRRLGRRTLGRCIGVDYARTLLAIGTRTGTGEVSRDID